MSIYVKDAILKLLPDIGNKFLPILFADAGIMPDRKGSGKTKACHILANLSGIYFCRPIKLSKQFKVSDFISVYNIASIQYINYKRRTISTRRREVFFECPHIDELMSIILTAHKQLLGDIEEARTIKLIDFPSEPLIYPLPPISNVSVARYVTSCLQTQDYPEQYIIDLIERTDSLHNPRLTLDQNCNPPNKLRSLHFPLIYIGKLKIITMKNFADYVACRMAHFFLKHSPTIDTIIFQGYTSNRLIPDQLRMENVPPRKLVSFVFINCLFDDSVLPGIFEELSKYKGEIQRISFNGVTFSLNSWNSVFDSIQNARSFKTLEILELNNIESTDITNQIATSTFVNLFKHRRFIQTFSCSSWLQPLSMGIEFYYNVSILSEIVFHNQNFENPFPNIFRFPIYTHSIDLSGCFFSLLSLKSLMNALSYHKMPTSLFLADIRMNESEFSKFYQTLPSLLPVTCIRELNWSGNKISMHDYSNFIKYIFNNNAKIRTLLIDRMFGSKQIEDLRLFLGMIGKNRLWKLSICGNKEFNFSGNFKKIAPILDLVSPLHILHFEDQQIEESEMNDVVEYLKKNQLTEVSFDGTCIRNEKSFFDFYDEILNLPIPIVGRPNKDIVSIFGDNLQNLSMRNRWSYFAQNIREKCAPLPESGISYFFCKIDPGDSFDPKKIIYFLQRFPSVYFSIYDNDPYSLGDAPIHIFYPALLVFRVKKQARRLADFHSFYLIEPTMIPRYRATTKFSLPPCFSPGYQPKNPIKFSIPIESKYVQPPQNDQQYDQQTFDQQQFDQPQFDQPQFDQQQFSQSQFDQQQFSTEIDDKSQNETPKDENCFIFEEEQYHKVIKKICDGTTSTVYQIIDTRTQHMMCKKVIKYDPEQITFKDLQEAMKEFEILHSINHPCICHAIGVNTNESVIDTKEKQQEQEEDEDDDDDELTTIALFLEYLEYKLTDLITQNVLNNTFKTKIVIEIVHGMAFIHNKGMIHRDFNINNIMLDSNYNSKIINFGKAKIVECLAEQSSFAAESMTKNIGLMMFMSPEMMNDENDYDKKTDVYSFGLVLFYIFAGCLPKYSLRDKSAGKPVPIPKQSPLMSDFCLDLISRCLENDKNDRPDFVQILDEIRKNSYLLTNEIDLSIISKHDKDLSAIDHL